MMRHGRCSVNGLSILVRCLVWQLLPCRPTSPHKTAQIVGKWFRKPLALEPIYAPIVDIHKIAMGTQRGTY